MWVLPLFHAKIILFALIYKPFFSSSYEIFKMSYEIPKINTAAKTLNRVNQ